MRYFLFGLFLLPVCALAGPLDQPWGEGAQDCKSAAAPPLEIHSYGPRTYILRENLCATFEAPFLYLLIGQNKALLIDSGDVEDPKVMPLAKTVLGLLPDKLPLLVVHTHRHLDHRRGDSQFAGLPDVEVVGYELDSVKRFYGLGAWPEGVARIDLGGRVVEALPTPGHNETEISFYDQDTGLFFSGDFLIPGRLLIDNAGADLASARRAEAFLRDRPVTAVLGAHIESDRSGAMFPWESTYHPNEHGLALTKADITALDKALPSFNGFYTEVGSLVMMNDMSLLAGALAGLAILLGGGLYGLVRLIRRYRARSSRSPGSAAGGLSALP